MVFLVQQCVWVEIQTFDLSIHIYILYIYFNKFMFMLQKNFKKIIYSIFRYPFYLKVLR